MAQSVKPNLRISGLPEADQFVDADLQNRAYAQLRELVARTVPEHDPPFRIGPDLVMDVLQDDGTYKRYEVIAHGTLLRDAKSRGVWPFPLGPKLVDEALPRIVAAAKASKNPRSKHKDRND